MIEFRFTRLTTPAAALAQAAAVIGNMVPTWLLETLAGGENFAALIDALAEADFVYPDHRPGMLRFKHGITRDVVYNTVGLHERRKLHLDIARTLQNAGGEDHWYEALAYHLAAGGNHAAAAHYAELAGDKAIGASALDRAQAQYRAALDELDATGDPVLLRSHWGRVFRRYVRASLFDPSREQVAVYERALAHAHALGDPQAVAWADYWARVLLPSTR